MKNRRESSLRFSGPGSASGAGKVGLLVQAPYGETRFADEKRASDRDRSDSQRSDHEAAERRDLERLWVRGGGEHRAHQRHEPRGHEPAERRVEERHRPDEECATLLQPLELAHMPSVFLGRGLQRQRALS